MKCLKINIERNNHESIYLRGLRHADHTVFCVQDGQKTYYDSQFGRIVPFSSGQQVKRSILNNLTDQLNAPCAPITFNYEIYKKPHSYEKGHSCPPPTFRRE